MYNAFGQLNQNQNEQKTLIFLYQLLSSEGLNQVALQVPVVRCGVVRLGIVKRVKERNKKKERVKLGVKVLKNTINQYEMKPM